MVECGEMFQIGAEVKIETPVSQETGVVAAFDQHTSMLTLKQPPCNKKDNHNNMMNINMKYATDVKIMKEADPNKTKSTIDKKLLPNISTLNNKFSESEKERMKLHDSVIRDISPEGRKLFLCFSKILENTKWGDNQEIIVMDEVVVKPPYREATVIEKATTATKSLDLIDKIIKKFFSEQDSHEGSATN